MRLPYAVLFIVISYFIGIHAVNAHGTGVSFEEEKDGYFIDIGYSEELPEAMKPLRFDFSAILPNTPEENVFTDVWVRIAQGRELYFSGGIHQPVFGSTGFTYVFPKEGEYEVTARFQNEGETVVETSFFLTVVPNEAALKPVNPYAAAASGLLVGLMSMFFLRKLF